jgi:hypothetical protein
MGPYGAEISNYFLWNNSKMSSPERFETELFQTGCLAFRSPAKIVFVLKPKSLRMSVLFQGQPGDV